MSWQTSNITWTKTNAPIPFRQIEEERKKKTFANKNKRIKSEMNNDDA